MQHSVKEEYFSGQGVVLVADRDPTGRPKGLRPLGNCPALAFRNATSVLEHKESTTGARGTDKRITTENKVTVSITVENFNSKNLALALRSAVTQMSAGTLVDEAVNGYPGLVTPLSHLQVSDVAIVSGADTLVPYVDDATPWDYKLNAAAGSFQLNDAGGATDLLLAPTAVTVGATTSYAIANSGVTPGDTVVLTGLAGADAAFANGIEQLVLASDADSVTTTLDTTGKVITTGAGTRMFDKDVPVPLTVSYTYAAQQKIGAYTRGAKELYLRFEGLNTAEDESPVVVTAFKFSVDPAQELALLSDGLQQFVMEGSVLADTTQPGDSKFYSVQKIDK